jgi:hypothetical protein
MKATCFCSVIYPKNLMFFKSFLKSLSVQTDNQFTLLLFNDGVVNLIEYLQEFKLNYIIRTVYGSPTEIRTQVFDYLKESNFDYTIFGDTDDYFPKNRVRINKFLLSKNDVIANDLCLVTEQEKIITENYWKDRKEFNNELNIASISKCNFLGLGNTAIRNAILPENTIFDEKIIAVDWFLFSRILSSDVKVCFTSDTFIYYRQHENNIVGRKVLTLDKFKREFKVKLNHYTILAEENEAFKEISIGYQLIASKIELISSEELKDYYKKIERPFWWEEIQICKFN